MKKYLLNIIILYVLSIILLGTCSYSFNSSGNVGEENVLPHVTFVINSEENRTLLPVAPLFAKYSFDFSANEGQTEPEENPVEVPVSGSSYSFSLAPGSWTVIVRGLIHIENIPGIEDGYYEGAVSEPVDFIIGFSGLNTVNVTVKSGIKEDIKGLFSYNVSFPENVINGSLFIQDLYEQDIIGLNPIDLINIENRSGTIALNPGYYFLKLELENNDHNKAYRTEILHIYSGLTTEAGSGNGYTFNSAHFTPMVTINGQVKLTETDGLDPRGTVFIFRDSAYTQLVDFVEFDEFGIWNSRISSLYTSLYMRTEVTYIGFDSFTKDKGPVNVNSANAADWIIDAELLFLCGTLQLETAAEIAETPVLSLYKDPGYNDIITNSFFIDDNGVWNTIITPNYNNVYLKAVVIYIDYPLPIESIKGPIDVNSSDESDWIIFCLLPNTVITIGDPSVKLYLNNDITPLDNNGSTIVGNAGDGLFTVSISAVSYSEIKWFVNGNLVAQGTGRTLIILPKRISGIYLVNVEATTGGIKNVGTHSFVVE